MLLAACSGPTSRARPTTTTTSSSTTTTSTTATTTTTAPAPTRPVARTGFSPMATAGPVTLVHPADLVERVGFHQSNHEGARDLVAAATAVEPVVLDSRERLSHPATAADVVVDPTTAIRAPVTGRVKRAGGYVLYCRYQDDYVVIEPDARPGWEVKVLHIDGEQVSAGQRVEAGVTVLAPRATKLPFASQVDDERTVDPAWPHVHVEVVDPSIPNVPSPGGGC